jgi:hypothetical protein
MRYALASLLLLFAGGSLAQRSDGGSDMRWNIGGPAWYETKCGQVGFSVTHGLPYSGKWVQPCSIPVRVCEYKRLTISFIADPDRPCEEMVRPMPDGGLVRTYLKRWD